jgi:hypothetical protein
MTHSIIGSGSIGTALEWQFVALAVIRQQLGRHPTRVFTEDPGSQRNAPSPGSCW